jgi:hypothetical protein
MWTEVDSVVRHCLSGLRQALALPLYVVALLLSFLSDALGGLAAKIAGDDWPR